MSEMEPIRVLCMEDDAALAHLLKKRLGRAGYSVDIAPDGKEGLDMAATGCYDVLLVDQTMPVYSGLEVIQKLASQGPLPPTVMVTGTGDERLAVEAMILGAGDYVVKDAEGGYFDLLPTVLDQVVERRRLEDEKRRAELQLERYAAELELRNKELGQLAHAISQDLRAPLANLRGLVAQLASTLEVIRSTVDAALPYLDEQQGPELATALQEDVPEVVDIIHSAVTSMDALVGAVLEWCNLGQSELKLEPVDMNALVQSTLALLAHQIEERRAEVKVGELPEVVADRAATEQIVGDLLGHALGQLDPERPGEIEIMAEQKPDETTFHVRDNGRGIGEEDQSKVFMPFQYPVRPGKRGEAMGLSTAQTLVRRHGGRIWCESEPGVGTTFSFTLSCSLAEGGQDE